MKKIFNYFLGVKKLKAELIELKKTLAEEKEESSENWSRYCEERSKIYDIEKVFDESFKHIQNELKESQKETTDARLLLRQIANHETTTQGIDKLKSYLKK